MECYNIIITPRQRRFISISLVCPHLEYSPVPAMGSVSAAGHQPIRVSPEVHTETNFSSLGIGLRGIDKLVSIPKLSSRRLHLKLAQVYKVVHQLCGFPEDVIQSQVAHSNRLARDLILHCPFACTNYYYHVHSFVPSSVRAWNSLSETLVNSPSLHSFKHLLNQTNFLL